MRRTRHLLALCAAVVLLLPAAASAKTVELIEYKATYTGAGSTGGTFPSSIVDVAVHEATGDILVLTPSGITKLDSGGAPKNFPATGTSTISGSFFGEVPALTVDNSAGPTNGRFYVADEGGPVRAFEPDGTELGGNFPLGGHQVNCGLAIDPQGDIWVANWGESSLREYSPSGEPTGAFFGTPSPCRAAIDGDGNFYVAEYSGPVRKYSPEGTLLKTVDSGFNIGVAVDPVSGDVYANELDHVDVYDPEGNPIDTLGLSDPPYGGLQLSYGVAVHSASRSVYATNRRFGAVGLDVFGPTGPVNIPDVSLTKPDVQGTSAVLRGIVNGDGEDTTQCYFEWGASVSYGNKVPCQEGGEFPGDGGDFAVSAPIAGLTKGTRYNFRLVALNDVGVPSPTPNGSFRASDLPVVSGETISTVNTDSGRVSALVNPSFGDTTYRLEWGTDTGYGNVITPASGLANHLNAERVSLTIGGLEAGTEYHFRFVAENDAGVTHGEDQVFRTFPAPSVKGDCPNNAARQQTRAAMLLDCRAYELVSAANTGSYDVASDLDPAHDPLPAFPRADGRVLYSVHHGVIPGVAGEPTNLGSAPYLAARGPSGWTTSYVGLPAGGLPSAGPFGSPLLGASADLRTFAFGGEGICAPCFADGGIGIPVRLPDGGLVQGMRGALDPGPAGTPGPSARALSADGRHLMFTSTARYEPDANDGGDNNVYVRDLVSGVTHLVSRSPSGDALDGPGIEGVDISADGSRALVGIRLSVDSEGNPYRRLLMEIGRYGQTVDVAPKAVHGVLFNGMSDDGSVVVYTAKDRLLPADLDDSADLYIAKIDDEGAVDVDLVSDGQGVAGDGDSCDAVPAPGRPHWNGPGAATGCDVASPGGGQALGGDSDVAYFFSPERLDGPAAGVDGQPNLYRVEHGGEPEFVATLDPEDGVVEKALIESRNRRSDLFQVSSDGRFAIFPSRKPLTGSESFGFARIFRFDAAAGELACASCAPTNATPTSDATLSRLGLNLSDDGRVFFTTEEPLVLVDTNEQLDAYEWKEEGVVGLISSGRDTRPSRLFSISDDGRDAFFFTYQRLVASDENGSAIKLYDARENGGFAQVAPPVPCQASDECRGPGSTPAPPPAIGSFQGTGGQYKPPPAGKKKRKAKRKKRAKRRGARRGRGGKRARRRARTRNTRGIR